MSGLLAVYRCHCDRAAATLLLLLSRSMSWVVMGLLKFPFAGGREGEEPPAAQTTYYVLGHS
eukprot:scaffold121337_cov24-Attheya_sp.AAC.1